MEISRNLQYLLDRLITLHRDLIELLRVEYIHMSEVSVQGLADSAQAKEMVLTEIWNHEQLRIKCVEEAAAFLKLDLRSVNLLKLVEVLPAAEGNDLRIARSVLNTLVSEARALNAKNMAFAESSLERIEQMKKNAMGLNNTAVKENYSNAGMRQPVVEQGGRLLSTEA